MNIIKRLQPSILAGLAILGFLLAAPPAANADAVDTVAQIMDYMPPGWPSGDDVRNSRTFFECVDQGTDALQCLDDFLQTTTGQQVFGDSLPSWFKRVVEGYVAVKQNDVWGAIEDFCEAGVCAVAQFVASGVDICGLIMELYNDVKEVVDFLEAFFADLGEVLAEAAKVVECIFTLGFDCGDDNSGSPPFPSQDDLNTLAYAPIVPLLQSGEALGNFESCLPVGDGGLCGAAGFGQYEGNVLGKAEQSLAIYLVENWGGTVYQYQMQTTAAGAAAKQRFESELSAMWSQDVVNRYPELTGRRSSYEQNIAQYIQNIIDGNAKEFPRQNSLTQFDPCSPAGCTASQWISNTCSTAVLNGWPLTVKWIDTWVHRFPDQAAQGNITPSGVWCGNLGDKYGGEFLQQLADYINSICPDGTCNSPDGYKSCLAALGAIGHADQCNVDVGQAGYNTAVKLVAYFEQQGSQFATQCMIDGKPVAATKLSVAGTVNTAAEPHAQSTIPSPNTAVSHAAMTAQKLAAPGSHAGSIMARANPGLVMAGGPAVLVCPRPKLAYWCDTKYNEWYGSVPQKLVSCIFTPDAAYSAFMSQVAVAVPAVKKDFDIDLQVPDNDKLLMGASEPDVSTLQNSHKSYVAGFAFGGDNGFAKSMDGVTKPTVAWDSEGAMASWQHDKTHTGPSIQNQLQNELGKLQSGDYVNPTVVSPNVNERAQTVQQSAAETKASFNNQAVTKEWGASQPSVNTAPGAQNAAQVPAAAQGGVRLMQNVPSLKSTAPGMQAPETKPMSGTLPQGTGPSPSSTTAGLSTVPRPPMALGKPSSALLPDLTSTEQITVAGRPVPWGSVLKVDAAQASSVNNSGLCEFVIEHSVRNAGAANAGSFRTAWTNEAVAGNWNRVWSPIAAGATSSAKELLPLKPGINFLQLLVDDLQQVQESNKTNNSHRVRIDVTGKCGPVK